jgi:chloramphenicol-sensitive protein RarD
MTDAAQTSGRLGAIYAFFAYFVWGLSPLFWKQLQAFAAVQILGFRVFWSCLILLLLGLWARSLVMQGLHKLRSPQVLAWTLLATVLIALNWLTYIWAVGQNRIVEASLGYYLNPIANILIGLFFFREQLSRIRWIAFGLALLAVAILLVSYGYLPWVSLVLAGSFAVYGLLKKWMGLDAAFSLGCETFFLLPLALWLILSSEQGLDLAWSHHLWFFLGGLVTLLPLFAFGKAAQLMPYSTLGFFQYIAPTLQLICAVLIYDEPFDPSRKAAFALIWASLLLISYESLSQTLRRKLQKV